MTAEEFWPWFWARMGISLAWFIVLEIVNAALPNGLLPVWLAAVLGLVAGFFGTFIFVAIWEHITSSSGSSHGGGGWDWWN